MIEFPTGKPELGFTLEGDVRVSFTAPKSKLRALLSLDEGEYALTVKKHRKARSLNANAYAWVLIGKIAEKLQTDNESVYLTMLERYGVFAHLIVKPSVVEKVKTEWRTVRELGEVRVNGKKGVQLQCFFGSHTYDTKEMSRLIDGIVSEAKELGIDTRTPEELSLMLEEWGA